MKNLPYIQKIDLHMHSSISDGTDSPEEIISIVRNAGIDLFSVTDHDSDRACSRILEIRKDDDPLFLSGIEFSCRDEQGKYHILGYGYDPNIGRIRSLVEKGHALRLEKAGQRLEFIRDHFGIEFPPEDIEWLYSNANPGKPHIANLMVKHGYAETNSEAFEKYLNKIKIASVYTRPEEAIDAILRSNGIPVLAHPSYGSGDELIVGQEMDERLQRLIAYGLKGVEGFYSGFSERLQAEVLGFAEKYDLYVTAGSDYHGKNKLIEIGDNNLNDVQTAPSGLKRFLADVPLR